VEDAVETDGAVEDTDDTTDYMDRDAAAAAAAAAAVDTVFDSDTEDAYSVPLVAVEPASYTYADAEAQNTCHNQDWVISK